MPTLMRMPSHKPRSVSYPSPHSPCPSLGCTKASILFTYSPHIILTSYSHALSTAMVDSQTFSILFSAPHNLSPPSPIQLSPLSHLPSSHHPPIIIYGSLYYSLSHLSSDHVLLICLSLSSCYTKLQPPAASCQRLISLLLSSGLSTASY